MKQTARCDSQTGSNPALCKETNTIKTRERLTCEQSSITSSTTEVLDFIQTRPAINSRK